MNVRVRKYSWQLAPADVRNIRQSVFVDEQKVPPELEWDDTDEIADHYLMVLPDNTPVGVARLFSTLEETAHIGRMAILPAHRGKGLGEVLLRHLVSEAAERFTELQLSAQEHAIPFYQRSGFHVCSDLYDDAGIPHVDMRCLAPKLVNDAYSTRENPMLLGEDRDAWLFDRESTMVDLIDSLTGQARQRIWLYDRVLDH
ncbi:MAG: GNAT family N-acetyltransferase, partial [Marinobacter sp.]